MASGWHIVLGIAKTGTTVVATTLARTLRIRRFVLEPVDFHEIDTLPDEPVVIKIVVDMWLDRIALLRELCLREGCETIAIVRDPRDEVVSRLHYLAYDFFSTRPTTEQDAADWIGLFRHNEQAPRSIGMLAMQRAIVDRFGRKFGPLPQLHQTYADLVSEIASAGRARILRYEDFVRGSLPDAALRQQLAGPRDVGDRFRRVERSTSSGAWHAFFSDEDVIHFNDLFKPFLLRFGYGLDREPAAPLAPASGSDYVERLILEARGVFARRAVAQ